MDRNFVRIALVAAMLAGGALPSLACFDTYSFLQKRSMVYPKHLLALETNGEYVAGQLSAVDQDLFSGNFNVYYGVVDRFSAQVSLSSAEKPRTDFSFDEWGVRGVYGLIQSRGGVYNVDMILEHRISRTEGSHVSEFSMPNIWHVNSFSLVAHPVFSFGTDMAPGLRGHGGVFYSVGRTAIVGVGGEYESAQTSAHFSKRLVKGEAATSLFFGSAIGPKVFLQNEFIKGWGAQGTDIGFATTLKLLLPTRR